MPRAVPFDYKLYVFHGRVAYVGVHADRFVGQTVRYYDREWTPQEFSVAVEVGPDVDEPERFDEIISVAEELAKQKLRPGLSMHSWSVSESRSYSIGTPNTSDSKNRSGTS